MIGPLADTTSQYTAHSQKLEHKETGGGVVVPPG